MNWFFERTETAPPSPESTYGRLLQKAYRPMPVALVAMSHVLHQKRQAAIDIQKDTDAHALVEAMRPLSKLFIEAHQNVKLAEEERRKPELRDELRISLFGILAPQLITLPALFRYPHDDIEARLERRNMVTGLFSTFAALGTILYEAHYARGKGQHKKANGLRATAMHEISLMALASRHETGEQCALPTLIHDRKQGRDIEYYGYKIGEKQGMRAYINSSLEPKSAPPDVFSVNGRYFGTYPYAMPWKSPIPFETLAAIHNESNDLTTIKLGRPRLNVVTTLTQLQNNLIATLDPQLQNYGDA